MHVREANGSLERCVHAAADAICAPVGSRALIQPHIRAQVPRDRRPGLSQRGRRCTHGCYPEAVICRYARPQRSMTGCVDGPHASQHPIAMVRTLPSTYGEREREISPPPPLPPTATATVCSRPSNVTWFATDDTDQRTRGLRRSSNHVPREGPSGPAVK